MLSIYSILRRRSAATKLARVFERSEASTGRALPIRKTGRGIWAATPVRVIEAAVKRLHGIGLLGDAGPPGHVIDAGTGDGRVSAVLAARDPSRVVYGFETDTALYAQAVANLHALEADGRIDAAQLHLLEADYCDVRSYERGGIALSQTAVVFNYPDGNERQLARFVAQHCGPQTTLCLLTHNRTLELDELPRRACHDVSDGTGPRWRLSLYSRSTAGVSTTSSSAPASGGAPSGAPFD